MPQTTVAYRQPSAIGEGQFASTGPRRVDGAIERFVNGMTANLPFGRVCVLDPTDPNARKVILPTADAATQPPIGITILNEEYGVPLSDLTAATNPIVGYPPGISAIVGIAPVGDYYMWSEEAITPADIRSRVPVLYRYAVDAAPNDHLGRIRKTAIASKTSVLPNARIITTTSAPGLVIVRLGA